MCTQRPCNVYELDRARAGAAGRARARRLKRESSGWQQAGSRVREDDEELRVHSVCTSAHCYCTEYSVNDSFDSTLVYYHKYDGRAARAPSSRHRGILAGTRAPRTEATDTA